LERFCEVISAFNKRIHMSYGKKPYNKGGSSGGGGGGGKGRFDLSQYIEVKDRIEQFVKDFPDGHIQTFIAIKDGPEIVFEARVYRSAEDVGRGAYTSGFAREVEGKGNGMINGTSHAENAETSAIGRALANMGYGTTRNRASRAEMVKVARMTTEHEEMIDWISTNFQAIPEAATIRYDGEEQSLTDFIVDNGEDIKTEFKLCRLVVSSIEEATGKRWAA
jgi:hypothetical protein